MYYQIIIFANNLQFFFSKDCKLPVHKTLVHVLKYFVSESAADLIYYKIILLEA